MKEDAAKVLLAVVRSEAEALVAAVRASACVGAAGEE